MEENMIKRHVVIGDIQIKAFLSNDAQKRGHVVCW